MMTTEGVTASGGTAPRKDIKDDPNYSEQAEDVAPEEAERRKKVRVKTRKDFSMFLDPTKTSWVTCRYKKNRYREVYNPETGKPELIEVDDEYKKPFRVKVLNSELSNMSTIGWQQNFNKKLRLMRKDNSIMILKIEPCDKAKVEKQDTDMTEPEAIQKAQEM